MGECRRAHAGSVAAALLRRVARRYGRPHDGPPGRDTENERGGDGTRARGETWRQGGRGAVAARRTALRSPSRRSARQGQEERARRRRDRRAEREVSPWVSRTGSRWSGG